MQKCLSNDTGRIVTAEFKYPYNKPLVFRMTVCVGGVATKSVVPVSINALNYRSSMEYFVVIGVFCFLYSLGVLVYYIMFEEDQTSPSAPPSKFSPPVIVSFFPTSSLKHLQSILCCTDHVYVDI